MIYTISTPFLTDHMMILTFTPSKISIFGMFELSEFDPLLVNGFRLKHSHLSENFAQDF